MAGVLNERPPLSLEYEMNMDRTHSKWAPTKHTRLCCSAFTLVELMVVIAILVILAGLVVPLIDSQITGAQNTGQQVTMTNLRNAWVNMVSDTKYTPGFNYASLQMSNLLWSSWLPPIAQTFNPNT